MKLYLASWKNLFMDPCNECKKMNVAYKITAKVPLEFGNMALGLVACMAAERVQLCGLPLQRRTLQGLSLQQE